MRLSEDKIATLIQELEFRFSRSSGAGGQHVNKTDTRVELRYNVLQSGAFKNEDKSRLVTLLKNRISQDGILSLTCQESRSQYKNKKHCY